MFVALLFVLVVLAVASNAIRTSSNSLAAVQLGKAGSDIAALLDHHGVLDTLNATIINDTLQMVLAPNTEMRLSIETDAGTQFIIGKAVPSNELVLSGVRVFVINDGQFVVDYGKLQYWIWLR